MDRRKKKLLAEKIDAWLERRSSRLFPKRAEIRLVKIMGGKTLTWSRIRSKKTGLPLTIILSRGPVLRREKFRHPINAAGSMLLFPNDIKRAIAVYNDVRRDIVAEQEYQDYLESKGWLVRYIPASWLIQNPLKVKQNILQFLN